MSLGLFVVLFVFIGGFAYMKMRYLIYGVNIRASITKSGTSSLIEILGNAKNATYVTLDGREIFIDKDGAFKEQVALLPGLSVFAIDTEDKFGNMKEKKLEVMYEQSKGVVAVGNTIINTN